ncbi:NepR family anti-sigma factor [uncultured Alsobacter sp.]|uniref:NepR family anti-sigma factor n=1 Tax=uncultured Alsobacter sp. TaxID=1748258 RepID=UPI00345CBDA5
MSQRRSAQRPEDQAPTSGGAPVPDAPSLQPQIQDHIGRQLRAMYDTVLNQPVPDRFRELMERLDAKEGQE